MICWCCGKRPNPKCKCDHVEIPSFNATPRPSDFYCRTHKKWSLPSE